MKKGKNKKNYKKSKKGLNAKIGIKQKTKMEHYIIGTKPQEKLGGKRRR